MGFPRSYHIWLWNILPQKNLKSTYVAGKNFIKILIMMTTLKIIISSAQGLLMILIKMSRPQNKKIKTSILCGLVIFIRNFDSRSILVLKRILVCCEVNMIIKIDAINLAWFHIFFSLAFLPLLPFITLVGIHHSLCICVCKLLNIYYIFFVHAIAWAVTVHPHSDESDQQIYKSWNSRGWYAAIL